MQDNNVSIISLTVYDFSLRNVFRDFPNGPMAKITLAQRGGPGFDPYSEN